MPTAAYKRRPRRTPSGLELPRGDGRTLASRRFRTLCLAFEQEIGGLSLTEIERGMVRQAALLQIQIEQLQADLVEGRAVDADLIIRLSSEARRILETLRGKASKRDSSEPVADLQAYLANKAAGGAP